MNESVLLLEEVLLVLERVAETLERCSKFVDDFQGILHQAHRINGHRIFHQLVHRTVLTPL